MTDTPSSEPPHLTRARELLRAKQPGEAAAVIRRYLASAAGTAADYLFLGIAYAEAGDAWQAIAALEQAAQIDPGDATIAYNLGLLYRKAGRRVDAATCFEQALALRPDYAAARKALEEVRPPGATPAPATASPGGAMRCPNCGMEPRSLMSCDWCGHPLAPPSPVGPPGSADMGLAAPPDPLEEGPLIQRLLRAAWVLIASPGRATDGALDAFFNSPGAPAAVIGALVLAVVLGAVVDLLEPHTAPHASTLLLVTLVGIVFDVVWVAFTAFVVAVYNAITGGSDSFAGDFGSLALSFALIEAVTTLAALPLSLPLALTSVAGAAVLGWILGFWRWILQIVLVAGATDLNWWQSALLLGFANVLLTWGLIGALSAALHM
jgi:hypothetical protein